MSVACVMTTAEGTTARAALHSSGALESDTPVARIVRHRCEAVCSTRSLFAVENQSLPVSS